MSAKRQSKVLCQRAVPYELYKGLTFTTIWLEVNPRKKMLERACEKTKVFSCVLLLMDVIVVILHKKGYSHPYPIRMLSYELLCGSCYFFLFIVIFIKIVSDRNEKYFKQYRFYSSSDNSFVPPVVFHDTKGPFCLNGSVHP